MSERMVTPEAVAFELETANVGSRLLAFALDTLVVSVGVYALGFTFAQFSESAVNLPFWLVFTTVTLLLLGWTLGYYIAFETLWRGRTLGKAALGLRVVTKEGGQVRFRHALIRTVLGIVDFGLSFGFVAVVSILATRTNQRLGDIVAGTLVLRERTGTRAPAPVSFAPPAGLEPYAAMLDTSRVTAREYQAARSFLLRAPELLPAAREQLAVRLANQLATLVTPTPPDGIPAASFLAAVAAAYQLRQRNAQADAPAASTPPAAPRPGTQPLDEPQPGAQPDAPLHTWSLEQPSPAAPLPVTPPAPAAPDRPRPPVEQPVEPSAEQPGEPAAPRPPSGGFAPPN